MRKHVKGTILATCIVIGAFLAICFITAKREPMAVTGQKYVLGFDSVEAVCISELSIRESQLLEYKISVGETVTDCFIDKAQVLIKINDEWCCIKDKERKYESSYTPIWFQEEQSPEASYLQLEPNTKHSDLFDVRNKYGRLRKGVYRLVVPVRVSGEYFDVFYEFSY